MNDIPLIQGVLEAQGFREENIRVLQDSDADAEGIQGAFRQLVRDAKEGDVVVFHFSGHGHRMTNDDPENDEETDGYDELLVPYGPRCRGLPRSRRVRSRLCRCRRTRSGPR